KRDDHDEKSFDDRSKPYRGLKSRDDRSETFHPSEDGKDFVKRDSFSERPKRRRTNGDYAERKPRFKKEGKPDFKEEQKSFEENRREPASSETDRKWNRKSGHEFYGDRKKSARHGRNDRKEKTESYK